MKPASHASTRDATRPPPLRPDLAEGLPVSDDPRVTPVLELCKVYVADLERIEPGVVLTLRCRISDGHVRLAVVVAEEALDIARALVPRHALLSTFVGFTARPTPTLTAEERGFLDDLIEEALGSWMHGT